MDEAVNICKRLSSLLSRLSISYCVTYEELSQEKLSSIPSTPTNFTVALPLKLFPGEKAIKLAALLTIESFTKGRNVSKYPALQFLLHLFSTRQIRHVINLMNRFWKSPLLLIRVRLCEKTDCGVSVVSYFKKCGIRCEEIRNPIVMNTNELLRIYEIEVEPTDSSTVEEYILTKIAYSSLTASK